MSGTYILLSFQKYKIFTFLIHMSTTYRLVKLTGIVFPAAAERFSDFPPHERLRRELVERCRRGRHPLLGQDEENLFDLVRNSSLVGTIGSEYRVISITWVDMDKNH